MQFKNEILKREEIVSLSLRELYSSWGYIPYKMSKFEPYDLYVQNKTFLVGDNILTFTDTNGKLMALKPDVTLSIIKNYKSGQQKVYYNENVYREGGGSHEFKEIMQAGIECIGRIDIYSQSEILMLAAESLQRISDEYILDIASVGIISGLMAATDADSAAKDELMKYVVGKNIHNIKNLCRERDIPEAICQIWETIASMYGPVSSLLPNLKPLCINKEMVNSFNELSRLCTVLESSISMNLDFSIISDMKYYNGLVFKGYIPGVPTSVLSGGRYDNLLKKMSKKAGAIGFAVYLDVLEQLYNDEPSSVDVLVTYGDETPVETVLSEVSKLRGKGYTVTVQPAGDTTGDFNQIVSL